MKKTIGRWWAQNKRQHHFGLRVSLGIGFIELDLGSTSAPDSFGGFFQKFGTFGLKNRAFKQAVPEKIWRVSLELKLFPCKLCVSIGILPLSQWSDRLCLYEPLPVSDLVFNVFFDFFTVFLARTIILFFQHAVEPCGRPAGKKTQKNSRISPLFQGQKSVGKKARKWPKWGIYSDLILVLKISFFSLCICFVCAVSFNKTRL